MIMKNENNVQLSEELKELLCQRFLSIFIKIYGKNAQRWTLTTGFDYISADFKSPDQREFSVVLTLKYFLNNTKEVYNLIKNPYEVDKEELKCVCCV